MMSTWIDTWMRSVSLTNIQMFFGLFWCFEWNHCPWLSCEFIDFHKTISNLISLSNQLIFDNQWPSIFDSSDNLFLIPQFWS
jgi:hypothetical protein